MNCRGIPSKNGNGDNKDCGQKQPQHSPNNRKPVRVASMPSWIRVNEGLAVRNQSNHAGLWQ